MQDRETSFIHTLQKEGATLGVGDDGVVIADFVIANDAFFEDVHFKRVWGDLEDIVEKCFLVNVSDIYAMNAIPKYLLLTLSMPRYFKQSANLAKIFSRLSKQYGLKIIGGDTIISDKLHFSLTLLGKKQKKILTRINIKKGDILGYITPCSILTHSKTQAFGKNLRHLKEALRFFKHKKIPKNTRFYKPILYPKMLLELNKIAKAGMDISDGIFVELSRLSRLNRVGFKCFKKSGAWLYAPEEYQMLYAVSNKNCKKMQNYAKKFRHNFIPFAVAKKGKYRNIKKNWHT